FVQRSHVCADHQVIDVLDVYFAAESFVVGRRDVVVKLNEVAFVIAQRMVRSVALVFQMLDKIVNVFLHRRSCGKIIESIMDRTYRTHRTFNSNRPYESYKSYRSY